MKKIIIVLLAVVSGHTSIYSQIMEDDFESNQYNWTEMSSSSRKALIKDGVMHLESKKNEASVLSTCYAPFDINKPFVMSVEALAKETGIFNNYGILLDYEDNQNYILFYINDDVAKLEIWRENRLVGYKEEDLKLMKGKKVGMDFEVEYNLNELIFKVNDIRVMAYRRRIAKDGFLLGTSGIGFYCRYGNIDFDNLKVIQ